MATGLYPENHGIIANRFYDRKLKKSFNMSVTDTDFWNSSEPIWMTAEKRNITTVVVNFPGCNVKGKETTYGHHADIYDTVHYSSFYLIDIIFDALGTCILE